MKKLLIVDDDKDLLEMVEMALSEQGFDVHTSTEGSSFFSQLEKLKPDIVLLDVFLQDADGRELCYQLKSDPLYDHIPVALYSAGHMSNSTIINSRADTFITKPFDLAQLGDKLRSMLTKENSGSVSEKYLDLIRECIPNKNFLLPG